MMLEFLVIFWPFKSSMVQAHYFSFELSKLEISNGFLEKISELCHTNFFRKFSFCEYLFTTPKRLSKFGEKYHNFLLLLLLEIWNVPNKKNYKPPFLFNHQNMKYFFYQMNVISILYSLFTNVTYSCFFSTRPHIMQ